MASSSRLAGNRFLTGFEPRSLGITRIVDEEQCYQITAGTQISGGLRTG